MTDIKTLLLDIQEVLIRYVRSPLHEIKRVPSWDWQKLLLAQILVTATTGALGGLVNLSIHSLLFGLLLVPILTLITSFVSALFFYYTFQIFVERQVPYRQLYAVVFFANIPFFIFQVISGYFPPISLIGLAFTALLLVVGFVENFELPRKMVIRLITALYVLFFLIWLWGRIDASRIDRSWKTQQAPEVRLGE